MGKRVAVRWIALPLALIGVVAIFAHVYGSAVQSAALESGRDEAERRTTLEISALTAEIDKFRVLPFVLTDLPDVATALSGGPEETRARLDARFAALARQTGATVLYAIDARGKVRAASNAATADSFVGYDFRFRPYFLQAMRNGASEYFAQGSVTGRPGMFLARRVGSATRALGVVVIKIEFDRIERLWRSADRLTMVVDTDGVIIIGSGPGLRMRTMTALPPARSAELVGSRQFGDTALRTVGIVRQSPGFVIDAGGRRYISVERTLPLLGWRLVHLEPVQAALADADGRVRFAVLIFALSLVTLIALVGWTVTRGQRVDATRRALEEQVAVRTVELTDAYERLRTEGDARERADARYRAAREELAQANRLGSIGTITTSVAHEINQPVAAIRTAAENGAKLIARGNVATAIENLTLIVSLTQRIGTITGELLSYARRGRRDHAPVALDDVVDGALLLTSHAFSSAAVTLQVERGNALPRVRASRIRLEQVLVNLLQNALQAVSGRAGAIVMLDVSVQGELVRMSVHDDGPGIAAYLGESIFQPFVTGRRDGTGLGLGISREIMADHGGALVVDRSHLGGAAFHATLPLVAKDI